MEYAVQSFYDLVQAAESLVQKSRELDIDKDGLPGEQMKGKQAARVLDKAREFIEQATRTL